jgi:FkbM family methyltransferase
MWKLRAHPEANIDEALLFTGDYEPESAAAVRSLVKAGHTCIDVGANIGFFSMLMFRLVGPAGRVFAFEPAVLHFDRLRNHVKLNEAVNVEPYRLALSDRPCHGIIHVTEATASIRPMTWGMEKAIASDAFEAVTLDDFCREHGVDHVDFIKVDTDGHEAQFLAGAESTLRQARPAMLVEAVPEAHPEGAAGVTRIFEALQELDYSLWSLCRSSRFTSPSEFFSRYPDGGNLVCLPIER